LAVECLASWDVVWQPGHVAEKSIVTMTDGLGDGRETSGRGDLIISDKLVPLDLQQLPLVLHIQSLEGPGVDRESPSPGFRQCCPCQFPLSWPIFTTAYRSATCSELLPDSTKMGTESATSKLNACHPNYYTTKHKTNNSHLTHDRE